MNVNIFLDIGYDIRGKRPGKKLAISYRFRETVSAEIPEVHPDEAPVAIVWKARKNVESRWKGYDHELTCGDINGQMMTRWYSGRHWLRLVEGNCGKTGTAADYRELTPTTATHAVREDRPRAFYLLGLEEYAPRSAKSISNPIGTFGEIAQDDRGAALEAISAISDNFISVGGILHVACAQPAIRVSDSNRIRSRWNFEENLAIETKDRYLDGSAGYRLGFMSYPLSDWDNVQQRVYAQSLDSGAWQPEPHLTRPEVFIPESLDRNIDARRAVDTLVKKLLFALPDLKLMNPPVWEFFDTSADQRLDLLEALLSETEAILPDGVKNDLLSKVAEIEDSMSVDVDLSIARPKLV